MICNEPLVSMPLSEWRTADGNKLKAMPEPQPFRANFKLKSASEHFQSFPLYSLVHWCWSIVALGEFRTTTWQTHTDRQKQIRYIVLDLFGVPCPFDISRNVVNAKKIQLQLLRERSVVVSSFVLSFSFCRSRSIWQCCLWWQRWYTIATVHFSRRKKVNERIKWIFLWPQFLLRTKSIYAIRSNVWWTHPFGPGNGPGSKRKKGSFSM